MPAWNPETALQEIARLTAPDVLGFYTHVEATTVFASPPGASVPLNVFSILVGEELPLDTAIEPEYLSPKPLHIESLKDWSFGVRRHLIPIDQLGHMFEHFCHTKEWQLSGEYLQVGELAPIPPQFVSPDSTGTVPLNRVLKNNFWNGSYVLEWADPKKTPFKQFFNDPLKLQTLSELVNRFVPIGIDGLSDRLGNIVVQLPIAVLIAKFGQMRETQDFTVTIAWHPKATPRPLRATCEKQFDHAISEFISAPTTTEPETLLPVRGGEGLHKAVVWDDQNRVLLASSGDLAFISSISLRMHAVTPGSGSRARVFTVQDDDGVEKEIKIPLAEEPHKNIIGEPTKNPAGDWTDRRIYQEDLARLAREKRFVQYKTLPGQQAAQHQKALEDLRTLLNEHGKEGAWLWDPYLTADDVLDTLFHCRHPNSDLRALSAGHQAPDGQRHRSCVERLWDWISSWVKPAPPTFVERQRSIFEGAKSNFLDLRLEFRMKSGPAGWAFHDRFLIFPATGRGALAWSLGTSVNSLGKQHHILQRVDDGQLIMQAFRELWDQLDRPDHLVWKKP